MRRLSLCLLAVVIAVTGAQFRAAAAGVARYPTYAEVLPILNQYVEALPDALRPFPGVRLDDAWTEFVGRRDAAIRGRLLAGDQETILNWLLFGTTFTSEPRALPSRQMDADEIARLQGVTNRRLDDLLTALRTPGSDERRIFARRFFESNGFDFNTDRGRAELRVHLTRALDAVAREQAQLDQAFAASRTTGDPLQAIALSQRIFSSRGLSLDTSLGPNFALQRALAQLEDRGLLSRGSVTRIGIVGAGLDFADKDAGFDTYPVQTVQPFALMDAVRTLQLTAAGGAVDVVAFDISPRVLAHIERATAAGASAAGYALNLALLRDRKWTPDFRDYWRRFGTSIGAAVAVPDDPAAPAELRRVRIAPADVRALSARDLNIVTQRLDGEGPFDLIVATNVLVYYDIVDQSIALANIASMLRPGGFLLSNTVLPEVPSVPVDVSEIVTTIYTEEGTKDVVVAYRKR